MTAVLKAVWEDPRPVLPRWLAKIEATGRGNPRDRWEPISIVASDPFGKKGQPEDEAILERFFFHGEGAPFIGLCRKEAPWNLTVTLAPDPWTGTMPDYYWGKLRLNLTPALSAGEKRLVTRWSHGVRLVIHSASVSKSNFYRGRPDLAAVTVYLQSEPTLRKVRVAVRTVNGVRVPDLYRQAKVDMRHEQNGPQCVADLDSPVDGFSLPNPGNSASIELELVGFRSAETVNFGIDPGKAKR